MQSWIFQGNPKLFQMDKYLSEYEFITWTVNQKHFLNEIAAGDEVYIWRANGGKPKSGGIVAKGKIISNPEKIDDDTPSLWIKQERSRKASRVKIKLEEVRLTAADGMLKREDLKSIPELKAMRILKVPMETNYKLDSEQAQHIGKLWEKNRKQ